MPEGPKIGAEGIGNQKQGKVLVVDDDLHALDVLSTMLQYDGYEVLTALTGQEALKIAANEPLDAILLDVRMPDMSGFEVIRELQNQSRSADVPVLFVSAQVFDGESIRKGLDLGARDYIPKPLNKPELLARISSVVRVNRMERKLRTTNETLKELDRRRREYLAMATHDLKVPLASVSTYCTLLLQGGYGALQPEPSVAVARIRALVTYMKLLVSNLLDLEKIEDGSLRTEKSATDLAALLREVVESVRLAAEEKNLRMLLLLDGELGTPSLDSRQMVQIVNNLVSNAIKFSGDGASVSLGARRPDGGLEIWVADTGPGIPLEEQQMLFRPFQQLSVKSTTSERGAGLGLCIVKNLVELQGGTIAVESAPGKGSRFTLSFPRAAVTSPEPS